MIYFMESYMYFFSLFALFISKHKTAYILNLLHQKPRIETKFLRNFWLYRGQSIYLYKL